MLFSNGTQIHSTFCHREGVARGDPLCFRKRTALIRTPPSRHDGLPRRSLRFLLAMTWCVVLERYTDSLHILSSRGRSPWRSTVFQKANRTCPYASIACSGLPRQTVVFLAMTNCMLWPNRILHFFILLSSRGRSPWRSTVSRKPSRTVRMRPLHAVDCRVPRSASSSQ